jgi:hypothetical protein
MGLAPSGNGEKKTVAKVPVPIFSHLQVSRRRTAERERRFAEIPGPAQRRVRFESPLPQNRLALGPFILWFAVIYALEHRWPRILKFRILHELAKMLVRLIELARGEKQNCTDTHPLYRSQRPAV